MFPLNATEQKQRVSRAESLLEGRVLARAGPDHETVVLQKHLRGGADLWIAPDRLRRAPPPSPPHIHARTNNPAEHAERRIHMYIDMCVYACMCLIHMYIDMCV